MTYTPKTDDEYLDEVMRRRRLEYERKKDAPKPSKRRPADKPSSPPPYFPPTIGAVL